MTRFVEVVYLHSSALLIKHSFRDVLEETVGFAADVNQLISSSEGWFCKRILQSRMMLHRRWGHAIG